MNGDEKLRAMMQAMRIIVKVCEDTRKCQDCAFRQYCRKQPYYWDIDDDEES